MKYPCRSNAMTWSRYLLALPLSLLAAQSVQAQDTFKLFDIPWGSTREATVEALEGKGFQLVGRASDDPRDLLFQSLNRPGSVLKAAFGSGGLVAGGIIQTYPPAEQYAKYSEYREQSIRMHGAPIEEDDTKVRWTKGGTAMLLSLVGRDRISVAFAGPGAGRESARPERGETTFVVTDTAEMPTDVRTVEGDLATATGDVWVKVGQSEALSEEVFLNPSRITRLPGGTWRAWEKWTFATPQVTSEGAYYVSQMSAVEFDCNGRRSRLLSAVAYNARGEVVQSYRPRGVQPEWREAVPESVSEAVLDALCGYVRTKRR